MSVHTNHPRQTRHLQGHENVCAKYLNAYENNRLHHAYILAGEKGIGKATFAYKAAEVLLSKNARSFEQVDEDVVAKIAHGSHPDLIAIELQEDDKEIKIETIRKLASFANLTPGIADKKVIIIDSIDDLNNNAANALLKLLEEPTAETYYFLICHSLGSVMPTIRSRCALFNFYPLDYNSFSQIISHSKKLSDDIISELYELAGGSISKANLFLNSNSIELYKSFEEAVINKTLADTELIKLCKKVSNDNWNIVRYFLEQLLSKKLKLHKTSASLNNMIEDISSKLELIRQGDRFHVDKAQLCYVVLSC